MDMSVHLALLTLTYSTFSLTEQTFKTYQQTKLCSGYNVLQCYFVGNFFNYFQAARRKISRSPNLLSNKTSNNTYSIISAF